MAHGNCCPIADWTSGLKYPVRLEEVRSRPLEVWGWRRSEAGRWGFVYRGLGSSVGKVLGVESMKAAGFGVEQVALPNLSG